MRNIIETISKKAGYTSDTVKMIVEHAEKMEKNQLNIPFDTDGRFFHELSVEESGRRNAEDLLRSCGQSQDFEIRKGIWLYPYFSDLGYLKLNVSVQETVFSELERYGLEWNSCFKIYPEDIIKNKISIPELGIDMKAIKFLQKFNIASKEAIDEYNKANCGSKKRFFCISKNPIDIIMASTDQSFTSCLNMESVYQRSYYLSLPAMIADTNRYICYITDKKLQTYQIFDLEIEHYRYQQRNWIIADTQGNVFIDQYYPANIYDVSDILQDIGISESEFRFSRTMPFDTGRFISKLYIKPMIYLDNLGIELNEDEQWSYVSAKGDQGELSPDIRCGVPFEYFSGKIDNYAPYETQKRKTCTCCGISLSNSDECYQVQQDLYCEDCYNDLTICSHCGTICDEDSYIQDGEYICSSCLENHYEFCDYCNRYHYHQTMTETDDGMVCDYHLHRSFKFCDVCKTWHKIDKVNFIYLEFEQEYVCQNCIDDYAVQCYNCKTWHKKDKTFKILSPAEYANDHFCYSCFVFRHDSCQLVFEEVY